MSSPISDSGQCAPRTLWTRQTAAPGEPQRRDRVGIPCSGPGLAGRALRGRVLIAAAMCGMTVAATHAETFRIVCRVFQGPESAATSTNDCEVIVSPEGWRVTASSILPVAAPFNVNDRRRRGPLEIIGSDLTTQVTGFEGGEIREQQTTQTYSRGAGKEHLEFEDHAVKTTTMARRGGIPSRNLGSELAWYAFASEIGSRIDWERQTQWVQAEESMVGRITTKRAPGPASCPLELTFEPKVTFDNYLREEVRCEGSTNVGGMTFPLKVTATRRRQGAPGSDGWVEAWIEVTGITTIPPLASYWPEPSEGRTLVLDQRPNLADPAGVRTVAYESDDGRLPEPNSAEVLLHKARAAAKADPRDGLQTYAAWTRVAVWTISALAALIFFSWRKPKNEHPSFSP